ncbi:Diaminopimelate decarboxylase [invertebrate metagenome]|uniref:diaminopimelate decarboxylase n=1 Tax=invertebrate metagenome TaxID=1711999 RepID=A0A2H9TAI0_9ZZZZ
MTGFTHQNNELYAEQLSVSELAERFGTPLYVYSRAALEAGFKRYASPLKDRPHKICYAVKANGNLSILKRLAQLGAGFDIVSEGELKRVLAAGGDPSRVVFSGVGKQRREIRSALTAGIYCFNVESKSELIRIQEEAKAMGSKANVSLRVNPDVDAKTHAYISTGLKNNKFGIAYNKALEVYRYAATLSHIRIMGIDCHIGSQLTDTSPLLAALDRLLVLVDALQKEGITLQHIDIGGGLGICYRDEKEPSVSDYLDDVIQHLGNRKLELVVEPGRSVIAHAGILLTRVELLKSSEFRSFAVVDAAMSDNFRPALYGAWQRIEPVAQSGREHLSSKKYDIVGPVCETADFLGKDRTMALEEGDLLAMHSAGAYGFVMSSNYNCRNRPAEIMVERDQAYLIRRRETIDDQLAYETPYLDN